MTLENRVPQNLRPRSRIVFTTFIWVNFITTSLFSLTGIMVSKGNHPKMALRFRLVKYDGIYPDLCISITWSIIYFCFFLLAMAIFFCVPMKWYEMSIVRVFFIIFSHSQISYKVRHSYIPLYPRIVSMKYQIYIYIYIYPNPQWYTT